jgi:hypothetical protein
MTSEEKQLLRNFLRLARDSGWRRPPQVWNKQFREALSMNLVTIGFGGVVKLTDAGRIEARK